MSETLTIEIAGRNVADNLAKSESFDRIISINDVGALPPFNIRDLTNVARLNFEDILGFEFKYPHTDIYDGPRKHHVEQIIRFAQEQEATSLLSHCLAGISRSTAAALIFATVQGHDPDTVLRGMLDKRPIIFPNDVMLILADSILDTNLFEVTKNRMALHAASGSKAYADMYGLGIGAWGERVEPLIPEIKKRLL